MGHTDVKGAKAAADAALGLRQLNERSREIFRRIVETYLETGEPVGSRNLSRALPMTLSPASVRNVMSDLEGLGLIYAPHTSAGRLPTQTGLRLFVDGLLEVGDVSEAERTEIEARMVAGGRRRGVEDYLAEAGEMLSGLSRCAGVRRAWRSLTIPDVARTCPRRDPRSGTAPTTHVGSPIEREVDALDVGGQAGGPIRLYQRTLQPDALCR